MTDPRALILAIGTELTSGQIINRNAAWLSQKLENLGLETIAHLTVPDDRALILKAFETWIPPKTRDAGKAGRTPTLVLITGGLGPTSDDFTREVVAEFVSQPLVYDEASWRRIYDRLSSIGIPVAESNRQQCYYPAGAKVLPNHQGTASAFWVDWGADVVLAVLPGPPLEIEAVWDSSLRDLIQERFECVQRWKLIKWQTLGKSESELGEIVDMAAKEGLAAQWVRTGYRASRPYVEIKLWVDQTVRDQVALATIERCIARVGEAISKWTVPDEDVDRLSQLVNKLSLDLHIDDRASGGWMLRPFAGTVGSTQVTFNLKPAETNLRATQSVEVGLSVESTTPLVWKVVLKWSRLVGPPEFWKIFVPAPYQLDPSNVRAQRFIAEKCLLLVSAMTRN